MIQVTTASENYTVYTAEKNRAQCQCFYARTWEKNNKIELEYSMLDFCSLQY